MEVNGQKYTAPHILIATGGKPVFPDIPGKAVSQWSVCVIVANYTECESLKNEEHFVLNDEPKFLCSVSISVSWQIECVKKKERKIFIVYISIYIILNF